MCNGVQTDKSLSQYVDLGDLSAACITKPSTCGSDGGTVSLWIKTTSCDSSDGVISSLAWSGEGFDVMCGSVSTNHTSIYNSLRDYVRFLISVLMYVCLSVYLFVYLAVFFYLIDIYCPSSFNQTVCLNTRVKISPFHMNDAIGPSQATAIAVRLKCTSCYFTGTMLEPELHGYDWTVLGSLLDGSTQC